MGSGAPFNSSSAAVKGSLRIPRSSMTRELGIPLLRLQTTGVAPVSGIRSSTRPNPLRHFGHIAGKNAAVRRWQNIPWEQAVPRDGNQNPAKGGGIGDSGAQCHSCSRTQQAVDHQTARGIHQTEHGFRVPPPRKFTRWQDRVSNKLVSYAILQSPLLNLCLLCRS